MRLIKLTKIVGLNNVEFIETHLNVEEIESFQKEKTNHYTLLFTKGGNAFEFKETLEEIIKLIENAKEI